MAKRVRATEWEFIGGAPDETGAMINLVYTCPHCHEEVRDIIYVGSSNVDKLNDPFETDQVCGICNEDVIVECY